MICPQDMTPCSKWNDDRCARECRLDMHPEWKDKPKVVLEASDTYSTSRGF